MVRKGKVKKLKMLNTFGKELIIDIHGCKEIPCTRDYLEKYFMNACKYLQMKRENLFFWDYDGDEEEYNKAPSHLKGISAVQFITTSNITIHTIDELKRVYVNIFSCKDFDEEFMIDFSSAYFMGFVKSSHAIKRI